MTYRENVQAPEPDRSVLVVGLNGKVFGVSKLSGHVIWQNNLASGGTGEVFIAIGYGVVVASAFGGRVFCLDYLTGETRWSSNTEAGGRATILVEPDRIIVAKGGYLDCFDPKGQHLWSQPLSGQGIGRAAIGLPGNVAQADDRGTE